MKSRSKSPAVVFMDNFSHFSIKFRNNIAYKDLDLAVVLIYTLLSNFRHTLFTLHVRSFAEILIFFLALGRQNLTFCHFDNLLRRTWQCLLPSIKLTDQRSTKFTLLFAFQVHLLSISVGSVRSQALFQRSADFSVACSL